MLSILKNNINFSVGDSEHTLTVKQLMIAFIAIGAAVGFLAIILNYIFGAYLILLSCVVAPCAVIGIYLQLDEEINPVIKKWLGKNVVEPVDLSETSESDALQSNVS